MSSRVFDIGRLPITDALLVGRDDELGRLDAAWQSDDIRVVTVVGRGGEGKTALVNAWLAELSKRHFDGKNVYDWTFYSQGTTGAGGASADLFFEHALKRFGYSGPRITSPAERGDVLARLLAEQPTLLVIDGIEPMQYGPGPSQGRLLDPGLRTLLRHLALHKVGGLCVLTTREPVADIAAYQGRTVDSLVLQKLSPEAGVTLLRELGARGSDDELGAAVEDMDGHALAVTLLGTYVRTVLGSDIRRRHEVALLRERRHGDHARRVMRSYEAWFGNGPERAVLRLLGLFDRAATGAEIRALREAPAIAGLTDALDGLSNYEWQSALTALRDARLLAGADKHDPDSLDAHPLVREYAAERMQEEQPEAWRLGHERLYRYLCDAAPERPDTMSEMRPLFWAVAHGCAAGRHQEVADEVLLARIDRWGVGFAMQKLGASGARLGAIACLFDNPFDQPAAALSEPAKVWLLSNAGFCLRALGRLHDARSPMQAALDASITGEHWKNASIDAGNLAELYQSLGELARAEDLARQGVELADQSGDAFMRMVNRTTLADVLVQRGQASAAEDLFIQAEAIQADQRPDYPLLYSGQGYRYCDLLLERAPAGLTQVHERASQALKIVEFHHHLLSIALDHLTLGRAWLLEAEHAQAAPDAAAWTRARTEFNQAVRGLREAGSEDHLPRGLIARAAWHRARLAHADAPGQEASLEDANRDLDEAGRDLDEAEEIAERGSMRLFLADIALERARLALAQAHPDAARQHLDRARELIDATGYHRRDRDLADLEPRIAEAQAAADTATVRAYVQNLPDKQIILCENKNDALFNAMGMGDAIVFVGVRDKNVVCIQTRAYEECHGLIDRDYLTDDEVERIRTQRPRLFVLEYYAIENYLYHPDNVSEAIAAFDAEPYRADIIRQKNASRDHILLALQKTRESYELIKTFAKKHKRNAEDRICEALASDEFETFYPCFDMKSRFKKTLLGRYNISEERLAQTEWMRDKLARVLAR